MVRCVVFVESLCGVEVSKSLFANAEIHGVKFGGHSVVIAQRGRSKPRDLTTNIATATCSASSASVESNFTVHTVADQEI
jgi:hypothetical protein